MRLKLVILFLLLIPLATATNHYTYEHAEEMRLSGRINWRDYGPEAFEEAIDENKPIFLMLTAPSWCYWCHVYTSDDYIYNEQVYPIIDNDFIPIYVDADKRQDLTRQWLEGGWPSTTILTPSRERMYGYSGPRPIANMIVNLGQASDFVKGNSFTGEITYSYVKTPVKIPNSNELNNLVLGYTNHLRNSYDPLHGGFGNGQKFPRGRSLDFALEVFDATGEVSWLNLVQNTLRNQYTNVEEIETNYNLFDPVDGGFHRYGTSRDWTPPHYEKMLYDNSRLLKAYFHLQQIDPNDPITNEVVEKTLIFMEKNWYDEENGGFYGNSDVHGEDEYYGKAIRSSDKPRVEKTKYSDWNTDAILTYLYLYETTGDERYREIAEKSLDFFSREMLTKDGAYHYYKEDGERGVRGSLLDNANLLVAFTEGYNVLEKDSYLSDARKLADVSLDTLYDWNSGGFFERNSPDKDLYAKGEEILLRKPSQENGIISFGLLNLYKITGDERYLNAAIKTIGSNLQDTGVLDRGYFYVKSAQFITQNNLLDEYSLVRSSIEKLENNERENFWLNELVIDKKVAFEVSEEGLEKLEGPIILLALVALFAGFISFASPCTLPILPAYLAYTFRASKNNIRGMTIAFFLGLTLLFTLLGMSATFIGSFLKENTTLFSQVAGIAIIFFGVLILLGKGFGGIKVKHKQPTSYIGSFLFGGVFGLAWTPCVGPILVAILLLASTTNSFLTGGLLLFMYAVGLGIPLILISTYLSKINKEGRIWRIIKGRELEFKFGNKTFKIHSNNLISGLLFLILGYLIFSGILFSFNQYVAATGFQKFIFGIEDWLLSFIN